MTAYGVERVQDPEVVAQLARVRLFSPGRRKTRFRRDLGEARPRGGRSTELHKMVGTLGEVLALLEEVKRDETEVLPSFAKKIQEVQVFHISGLRCHLAAFLGVPAGTAEPRSLDEIVNIQTRFLRGYVILKDVRDFLAHTLRRFLRTSYAGKKSRIMRVSVSAPARRIRAVVRYSGPRARSKTASARQGTRAGSS